jgi:hypothetical protein
MGKPGGKRPLRRPRRRGEDNIKMDPRKIGWCDMDWITWLKIGTSVNTVMNLQLQ